MSVGLLFMLVSVICVSMILFYVISYEVNVMFLSFSGNYFNLGANIDFVSIFAILMLLICFTYVLSYSKHYFDGDNIYIDLNKIICIFVGVMSSLILTGDFLSTLIFWEYLGVVSFFLILFYSSYLSLRSSIITLVSSRFGDVSLFMLIMISSGFLINIHIPLILIFLFIILTKSASFPFISWLLEAMRAPTPISSLVHSSTLVAAGVWFSMRYDFLLYFDNILLLSLLLLLTIFISGVSCFFFIDLKKIVALSTCNNVSWCVLYLIFGDTILSLFQLISHGVSKCMLFMLVGDVMSGSSGSQSSNCVYNCYLYGNWGIFSLFSIILGLSGAPFIGVFFTKHLLLTNIMNVNNVILSIVILMCVFISYFYSFRFCSILLNTLSSSVVGVMYCFNSGLIIYFWLFINFLLSFILDEVASNGIVVSTSLIMFQIISCFTAYVMYNSNILVNWSSSLFGSDSIVESFYYTFANCINICSTFFYRWDNFSLNLFNKNCVSSLSIYTSNNLNIIMISIFLFLMCYCIVYN
uniref:NADH:ubiquinone reductase (H(+)-translocating) n=3 Tax=Rodentolepis nana TaxID=102285 RepID=A0A0U3DJY8_RODNA|nr:NADH dehydrogenase subunit 5 [Rodentolepis nana]ALT58512.1 NADH dehydrogenase subunit 5 [Rodentolepis nana]BAV82526.1 NADH dehydrogenase subunit 5 [Rodentolepis nana]BBB87196.1 NADH dehydrogenase subunit 5 [Rodentolepis nana]